MQRKKSGFWLFIWSLMPGAGEMYMGFMKMGISLMLGFMGLIAIAGITNLGVLAIFPVTMWFYSFFHANHLASLDEESFRAIEDRYLFGLDELNSMEAWNSKINGKKKTMIAAVFILIGVIMLWNAIFSLLCDIFGWDNYILSQIYYFMRDDVPRFVIGIAIIWVGVVMIRGKKENIAPEEESISVGQDISRQQNDHVVQNQHQNDYSGPDQQNSYNGQNVQ